MASSSSARRHDVFLSFRGEDTRKTIVSHLFSGLQSKGIITFQDDKKLRMGDSLPDELPKAIEESKFAIVVISKNYATSRWCLNELEMIMQRNKKGMLNVIPVFHAVDPSDVRKQRGIFAEAFEKYEGQEEPEKVKKWREALADVADLTGVDSRTCQDEATMVCGIVGDISNRLFSTSPKDTSDMIGMDAHLEALAPLLSMGSNDETRMIGIWGMGGVGKTTVANCLYNKLKCQFPFHCFIDNVKKIYSEHGEKDLQRLFLSKILRDEKLKSQTFEIDCNKIKARLRNLKVVAILDDVDRLDQLQALAKGDDWFGRGSRIIVTTRDKGLLISHNVKLVYEVKCLGDDAALRLFNHFAFEEAFRERQPSDGYVQLSICASKLVQGLPLALKVFGSYLRGRTIEEWEAAICRLRGDPHKIVMESLKVSYDGLDEQNKAIFLCVACLFNKECVNRVAQLLDGVESVVRHDLNMLVEKSLIDISKNERVTVHDLILEMAKEIVCLQSINEPGRRRFLWDATEIYEVLEDGMGTDAVEGISLNMSEISRFPTGSRAFENIRNLRFLQIHNSFFSREDILLIRTTFNFIPRRLRLLDWVCCPLATFPSSFRGECLVELRLRNSDIEKLWDGTMPLGNLKRMDLSFSYKLKAIPDLSKATNLEELDLSFCCNLAEVPRSLSGLKKLSRLYMQDCRALEFLPNTTGLKSLKVLIANGCIRLKSFPALSGSIEELAFGFTGIIEVPESIHSVTALKFLDLSYCRKLSQIPSTIGDSTALKTLNLTSCQALIDIPGTIGNLTTLEELDLRKCVMLGEIPSTIGNLTALKKLNLRGCQKLTHIPNTLGNLTALQILDLMFCKALIDIPSTIGNLTALEELDLRCCEMLGEIPSTIGKLTALKALRLGGCQKLRHIPNTIGNLTAVQRLDLMSCKALIDIPSTIDNLSSIEELDLLLCEMRGEIPSTIGGLTALERLSLKSGRKLKHIPYTIGNLTALQILDLSYCELLMDIPSTIGNLTVLQELILNQCMMLTEIPSTIGNLTALERLSLQSCWKLKHIPKTIGNLTALKKLDLSFCKALKDIPSTIGNLTVLQELILNHCEMLTEIPSTIGNLTALERLSLRSGKKLKHIPYTIGNLTALKIFSLSSCEALIDIPSTIGNLTVLQELILSQCTMLTEIPSTIGNLTALERLSLQSCWKLKHIPNTIENLTALKKLDLSFCKALKDIPSTIGNLTALEELDLNYCEMLTDIPSTVSNLTDPKGLGMEDCKKRRNKPTVLHALRRLDLKPCRNCKSHPADGDPNHDGQLDQH